MATPTDYDITLYVNDVDVTAFAPYQHMSFDDQATQVSWLRFTLQNPSGVTPANGMSVKMTANSLTDTPTVFLGNIKEVKTRKRDNGITIEYDIESADYKDRLQNSVIDVASFTGSDTDILSSLLGNAYPDLSDIFDFSGGVDGFIDSLDLLAGNKSILDALADLSDLAGGADWRFENVVSVGYLINFDGGLSYTTADSGTITATVTTGGNTGNCIIGTATNPNTSDSFSVIYDHGSSVTLDAYSFDLYADIPANMDSNQWAVQLLVDGNIRRFEGDDNNTGGWVTKSYDATVNGLYPANFTGQVFTFRFIILDVTPVAGDWEVRLDNIEFTFNGLSGGAGTEQSQLQWGLDPDLADFNFNIDTSDEFGNDFELTVGSIDYYNSITVIGGNQEVAVDWTYPNQDSQVHINLETAIEDIVVYENTGTEGTPTWTELTVANAGEGELGVSGVEVIYDPVDHWLEFDSAPPDFYDAVRVTGNILRPIRVRVEDVADGDPIYATTYKNENITSTEQAISVGASKLNQQNEARHLTFTTHEPGLKTGQEITVTDSNRGLSETLKIQRIQTRWLSPKLGEFQVECGEDSVESVDTIIANNDKRSRENQLEAGTTTVTYDVVVDDRGRTVVDDTGKVVTDDT